MKDGGGRAAGQRRRVVAGQRRRVVAGQRRRVVAGQRRRVVAGQRRHVVGRAAATWSGPGNGDTAPAATVARGAPAHSSPPWPFCPKAAACYAASRSHLPWSRT